MLVPFYAEPSREGEFLVYRKVSEDEVQVEIWRVPPWNPLGLFAYFNRLGCLVELFYIET